MRMVALERRSLRVALRLGRRHIKVNLHGSKMPEYIWSDYSMSRGIDVPVQRMPKVGHFSVPRKDRGLPTGVKYVKKETA